jgi:RHS repeat-associated protein
VTSNYTYYAIYQLTQVMQGTNTTESYSYDPVGNRTVSLGVSSYTTNASNELTATPGVTYTYDSNGNILTKTDSTGTTSYTWDFENRLASLTLPGTGGTVTFKYDPFGKRIYKSSSSGTSIFAYDGDNLTEETNSSGAVVARYTQTNEVDEPLAMLRSGATSYYEADGLGTITSVSGSAGSLAQTYGYDSFGKQTSSSGSLTNPLQYTARELDPETNMYFYRARYYDPVAGRFVSEDPVGFSGGFDFYSYAFNRPLQLTDPMGLSPQDIKRILEACQKCTKQISNDGFRSPGTGILNGWWNNLVTGFSLGHKYSGCLPQAQRAQPCLENPARPFDDFWSFGIVPVWGGTHWVVRAWNNSNPSEPYVICDPWLNIRIHNATSAVLWNRR